MMRTTLNLDDDVAEHLGELAREREQSLSRVANEAMRVGLRALHRPSAPAAYEPPSFDTGAPLLDVTDTAEALEVIERD